MLATSWFTISEGQEFLMVERHSNKAQRQRELDTHIFTMQVGRECELKMEWGINTIKSMPRDVLPPARLYLLKVPQPPQAVLLPGDQVFKYLSLCVCVCVCVCVCILIQTTTSHIEQIFLSCSLLLTWEFRIGFF